MPTLRASGLTKAFGGVRALEGVDLDLEAGQVHALCGENGAGKSTLNKLLSGALDPDAGSVELDGRPLPRGTSACERAGVFLIHQEATVLPDLPAEDNLFIGREPGRAGLLDRAQMRRRTAEALARLGVEVPLGVPLRRFSHAQCRLVAIARALVHRCRVLILDEPTAALADRETDALFRVIGELAAQGVAILYVTHRLDELARVADQVTVLRDGRKVASAPAAQVDRPTLIRWMVGREVSGAVRAAHTPGEVLLSGCGLELRAGEVVGIAGLVGSGRSELLGRLFGTEPRSEPVRLGAGDLRAGDPGRSVRSGLALAPEERRNQGLVLPMSVQENLALGSLHERSRFGLIDRRSERTLASRMASELAIKAADANQPVGELSGGNQQKVLLGKWMAARPRVFLLDEPTRGIDVGARQEVHKLIDDLAAGGAAVLVVSSDLPELLSLSDRVLVMREGQLVAELSQTEAGPERVMELALPAPTSTARRAEQARELPKRELAVAGLLLAMVVLASALNPAFADPGNLRDLLIGLAPTLIAACGLMLVVLTGEIDISLGSLMGLTAALAGTLVAPSRLGLPTPVAMGGALALGLLVGLANGWLTAYVRVPSIIVTLAGLGALRGVTELVMGGVWITDTPASFRAWGVGTWLGVPVPVVVAGGVVLATALLLARTGLGRRIIAVGSDPGSALALGLPVRRVKLCAFALAGLSTALAMAVSVPRLSVIESGVGTGFELLLVTCVVVGGVSIRGGRGSVWGVLAAVGLMSSISTILIFLKLGEAAAYWEKAAQGLLILLAILADHLAQRRRR